MDKLVIQSSRKLINYIWPEFIEVDGSIFLAESKADKSSDPQMGLDRTGMEAFVNHIHMIDIFSHQLNKSNTGEVEFLTSKPEFEKLWHMTKIIGNIWLCKLRSNFPNYEFRVYCAKDDNPTIRFHSIHNGESNWIDEDKYSTEISKDKLIILDTRNQK